ncbi:MAG: twin-arginine translocase subunit TatC [Prevotellaceae bacterium]|nr:twin-arginine translocase subunit TatC [Prevotellaceae bacterium]
MTFWDHLDVLRGSIVRMLVAAAVGAVAAFALGDRLFAAILAPTHSDYFLWRWMKAEPFSLPLVNTELTEQFMAHMRVALVVGLFIASPYIIYLLFRFISPALYEHERRYSQRITFGAYLMFILGAAMNYLLIFPLTVRFLGTYQVSTEVTNMLTLSSYIDTLLMMSLLFGIMFEIPIVCWLLALAGLLRSQWMVRYRRHAIVAILIVAAVITPTGDIFTLLIVSLPIWLLYEASILIVRRTRKQTQP